MIENREEGEKMALDVMENLKEKNKYLTWRLVRNELPEFRKPVIMATVSRMMLLGSVTSTGWKRDNGEVRKDIVAWRYVDYNFELYNLLESERG